MNEKNSIEYTEYYIAFLDILGFKKLVYSRDAESKQKISEYFSLIKSMTNILKMIHSKRDIGSIVISDSVILSVPIGNDDFSKVNNLRQLCIAIQKIQYRLARMNIWLRGGISSGEAYFDASKSQVVGPAYINAFLLEERNAINPRVILDNKLIHELGVNSAEALIDKINNMKLPSNNYLITPEPQPC